MVRVQVSTTPSVDIETDNIVYLPGASAYDIACRNGFSGTEAQWLASLHGEDGADGTDGTSGTDGTNGQDGKSAYAYALENGYIGTEAAFGAALSLNSTHTAQADNPHNVTKAQVGLGSVDNVRQYSAGNPPPYPVTSVNGQTGDVTISLSGKEDSANKVTSLSADSTDSQYPSAKCVYDLVGNVESALTMLR